MMKTNYLLPNRFKRIGWIMLIPALVFGILWMILKFRVDFMEVTVFALFDQDPFGFGGVTFFTLIQNNILDQIVGVLIIVGSIFIAFSRENPEDEFMSKVRLESLMWATYINYGILILAMIFVYNMAFFWVLVMNMFTILLFFVIRYNWVLYKSKKTLENEE